MSEGAPETGPTDGAKPDGGEGVAPPPAVTAEDVARLQAALEKERGLHKAAKQQLSQFQQEQRSAMDDGERRVLEAREAAAAEVRQQYGAKLAQTEFKAAAVARNPEYDVAKALKYVNLASMVGEDGEPDVKAIAAAVNDLIPEGGGEKPPSFDGGSRSTPQGGPSMTQLIRQAAGRA